VETILSQHCQRVYTAYIHSAKILARINIIFPVFADLYLQRQLQKCTRRRSPITVQHSEGSSDYFKEEMPKMLWCLKHAKVSSTILLWISMIYIRRADVVKVQRFREVLSFVKHSTLITEFRIYKFSSDLQSVDVRRYNGVFVTSLLQTWNPENFACKSRLTVWRNGYYGSRPSFFVKLHFMKIFGILWYR